MDKQNADKIITEYLQKLYGFAVKKSFSYDEAEELCAEIVKEVYVSLLKADEIHNIEGYIWRVSENTYAKYISSKKRHEGISIDGMEIPYFEEYELDDSSDEVMKLRREIAFLTEKRRKVVYMFYYENKSVTSIARTLKMPEGTVKWHLNKARNELKEGFTMERKIGKLGMSPITEFGMGHSGDPGSHGGPEYFIGDKINLNIVYSVYYEPRTAQEIAEELGVTLAFIEDKIKLLEDNGFLVRQKGDKFTTYVKFGMRTYSCEQYENELKTKLKIADILAEQYVPLVRKALEAVKDVYIPSGNRELFEAAVIFYAISNNCKVKFQKRDLSKYYIKPANGGEYITFVNLYPTRSDPEYVSTLSQHNYWVCGHMTRWSEKYDGVYSWSCDSRLSSREGAWENNYTSDYEYLYEFMRGDISDNTANADKFKRLKKRKFLTEDNKVNIMVLKGREKEFFSKLPNPDDALLEGFTDLILEAATQEAKNYPPQMHDLVIDWSVNGFVGTTVALMVIDKLYENGTFKPLSENEKVTVNLLMFSDIIP